MIVHQQQFSVLPLPNIVEMPACFNWAAEMTSQPISFWTFQLCFYLFSRIVRTACSIPDVDLHRFVKDIIVLAVLFSVPFLINEHLMKSTVSLSDPPWLEDFGYPGEWPILTAVTSLYISAFFDTISYSILLNHLASLRECFWSFLFDHLQKMVLGYDYLSLIIYLECPWDSVLPSMLLF